MAWHWVVFTALGMCNMLQVIFTPSELGTQKHWFDQLHLIHVVFSGQLALGTNSRAISVSQTPESNGATCQASNARIFWWLVVLGLPESRTASTFTRWKESKTLCFFSEVAKVCFASCYDLMWLLHLPFGKQQWETTKSVLEINF